jgi:hypothetical protein
MSGCPETGNPNSNLPENAGDIHVTDAHADPNGGGGYEYVTERPLAIIALAEARNIPKDVARAAVDKLADRLDICVTEHGNGGVAPGGAVRVVAIIAKDGSVRIGPVRFDADDGGASTAAVCLIAPMTELVFPATADGAQRGLAIEAMWGSGVPHSKRR